MQPMRVMAENGPVVVDVCTHGCGGVWLDEGDQRAGIDISDDLTPALEELPSVTAVDCSQPVSCPVCSQKMLRFRWNYNSPVYLDACDAGHGTWIDAGEPAAMELWETQQLLSEPKRSVILARVQQARMEGETSIMESANQSRENPMVHFLTLVFRRLDGL
jgi:Zn-finger nucleic acid-binding protein